MWNFRRRLSTITEEDISDDGEVLQPDGSEIVKPTEDAVVTVVVPSTTENIGCFHRIRHFFFSRTESTSGNSSGTTISPQIDDSTQLDKREKKTLEKDDNTYVIGKKTVFYVSDDVKKQGDVAINSKNERKHQKKEDDSVTTTAFEIEKLRKDENTDAIDKKIDADVSGIEEHGDVAINSKNERKDQKDENEPAIVNLETEDQSGISKAVLPENNQTVPNTPGQSRIRSFFNMLFGRNYAVPPYRPSQVMLENVANEGDTDSLWTDSASSENSDADE